MKENFRFKEEDLVNFVRNNSKTLCRMLNNAIRHRLPRQADDMPDIFCTDEALRIFENLRSADILDDDNMPNDLSMAQKGVLAFEIARRIGINNVWAEFERLWDIKRETLRKKYECGMRQRRMRMFIDKVNRALNS